MLILLLAGFNGFRMVSCSLLAALVEGFLQSNRTGAAKCVPVASVQADSTIQSTSRLRVTGRHSVNSIH